MRSTGPTSSARCSSRPTRWGATTFDPDDARELWDLVNRQDWAICESVQRGMSSRSYHHGWFAPMEDDSLDIRRWLLPTGRGTMTERFDYVVAGLGALGSATAMELAQRGHRVLGLERFDLGHDRGASHDTSRILRHSYHTPAYVRLTQEAYADWARLERDSGEQLVTTVGGLDLFPPEPAISPADYTSSLDQVGIDYELLDAATVMGRWPQLRAARGHARAPPGGRRDRARRTRHRGPCSSRRAATARSCATAHRCWTSATGAAQASR